MKSLIYADGEIPEFLVYEMNPNGRFEYMSYLLKDGTSENYACVDGGKPIAALLQEVDKTSIDERTMI